MLTPAMMPVTAGKKIAKTAQNPSDPAAPVHGHVAPTYIEGSEKIFGIPNVVTNVLASYRGFDTLGEVAVIFTAGVGVLLLLSGAGSAGGLWRGDEEDEGE